jgi:nucleoside-diphosphate-sugar epimerase
MIGVTGANGYVGGRILDHLRSLGSDAIALVRRPEPGDHGARPYSLGEPLGEGVLDGVHTVVHAAYDASPRGAQIAAVNVAGSMPLLDGLHERGGRAVLISSLSAFDGTRSLYGQAKLALERAVLERGGIAVRPGLVFGVNAGGLFGAMANALSRRSIAPMIGGGRQRLFVTHDEHLAGLIAAVTATEAPDSGLLLFAAHEVPTNLRGIAGVIAAAHGHRLTALPVPAAPVALALRSAELAGLQLPFRSDSLVSLMNPIPLDQVSALARSEIEFPPLVPELWL